MPKQEKQSSEGKLLEGVGSSVKGATIVSFLLSYLSVGIFSKLLGVINQLSVYLHCLLPEIAYEATQGGLMAGLF